MTTAIGAWRAALLEMLAGEVSPVPRARRCLECIAADPTATRIPRPCPHSALVASLAPKSARRPRRS